VLESIAGQSMFAHCVRRLRANSDLPVILATTSLREDDVLAAAAEHLGVPVVRGPEDDVLARYVLAAATFALVEVIRATADNPAVDTDAPRRTLEMLRRTGADHVVERGMPVGGAVEAIRASALFLANASTIDPSDREHVTPFIVRQRQFVSLDFLAPGYLRCPTLRLTVDTPDDLVFMRRVMAKVAMSDGAPAPLRAIMVAAELMRHADCAAAEMLGQAR
jgi:spore coat polysaccharide biosynthesis protein SpsF